MGLRTHDFRYSTRSSIRLTVIKMKTILRNLTVTLTLLASLGSSSWAAPSSSRNKVKNPNIKCPIVGLVQLEKYLLHSDRVCFKNAAKARAQGYLRYAGVKKKKLSRPVKRLLVKRMNAMKAQGRSANCSVVGVPSIGFYFTHPYTWCFINGAKAKAKGFTYFQPPTPVATISSVATPPQPMLTPYIGVTPSIVPTLDAVPIATQPPVISPTATEAPDVAPPLAPTSAATPTPIPEVTPLPVNFSFDLSPSNGNFQYSGHCEAVLRGNHDTFFFSCDHDVTSGTVAHFHLLDNTFICEISSPASSFSLTCAVTKNQADQIKEGRALVDIHIGSGEGSDQVLAGLVIPPA